MAQPGGPAQSSGVPFTLGLPTVQGFNLGPHITPPPFAEGWRCIGADTAVPAAIVVPTQATTFAVPSQNVPQFGWYQPLSTAAPVVKAREGSATVPFNTPQFFPKWGWQQPLNTASPPGAVDKSSLTFVATPSTLPSGWQSQTSVAAPVATAKLGSVSSPLGTPAAPPPPNGWFGPVSNAVKGTAAQSTQATTFAVPPQAAVTPTTQFGWYQPLSKPVPVATAKQGDSFVPFNTVQIVPSFIPLVQEIAAATTANVYYQSLFNPLPPIAAPQPPPPNGWYSALSGAPRTAQANATQATTFAAPPPATPPAGIAGMAWYTQLGTVATTLKTAPQGMSFVPFDTPQVIPPPPPPSDQPEWKPFLVTVGKLMGMG